MSRRVISFVLDKGGQRGEKKARIRKKKTQKTGAETKGGGGPSGDRRTASSRGRVWGKGKICTRGLGRNLGKNGSS